MTKFRTRYSAVNDTPGFSTSSPSLALQEDYESTLIPNIINQHLPQPVNPPQFGDFTTSPDDLLEAYSIIEDAESRFAALTPEVKSRFGNDPAALLAFLQDPGNRDEAVRLGLVNPTVTPSGAESALSDPPSSTNT